VTAEQIADRLEARRAGSGWVARCPAHDDKRASLSVGAGDDGRVLLSCHAGCTFDAILAAAHLTTEDVFPPRAEKPRPQIRATYPYCDESGAVLFEVVRFEPKDFRQRRPDGKGGWEWKLQGVRRVPFRLPELLESDDSAPVFVVEGEKDALSLARLGLVATTTAGGATNWKHTATEARGALAGRDVVILPDNDDAGRAYAQDALGSLAGAARSLKVLALPGLPLKGDASDWVGAGGTADALLALVDGCPAWRPGDVGRAEPVEPSGFVASIERLKGEAERRRKLAERRLSFGVGYLDHALGDLLPNDLALVGAYTGVGKTQLVTLMARTSCAQNKRVAIFALEAERDEIERRIKYAALADAWYERRYGRPSDEGLLSYRKWYMGELDEVFADVEAAVERKLAEELRGLSTFYRGASFGLDDLDAEMRGLEGRADLVILDHLHYVDVGADESEQRGYKQIVKRVRDLSLASGVPVALVVHLRKRDRGVRAPVPELDDIHGTSDVAKICTKAVMLAPVPRSERAYKTPAYKWPTYFATPKDRSGGVATRYVGMVNYDARRNAYDDEYQIGRVVGEKWLPLPRGEVPPWAIGATRQPEAQASARTGEASEGGDA